MAVAVDGTSAIVVLVDEEDDDVERDEDRESLNEVAVRRTSGAVYLKKNFENRRTNAPFVLQKCATGCCHRLMLGAFFCETKIDDFDFSIRIRSGK